MTSMRRLGLAAACALAVAACGGGSDGGSAAIDREAPASVAARTIQSAPTASMQAVLDELAALGAKPIETLTVAQARTQPTPADAVRSLLAKRGLGTAPEPVASVVDSSFPGPAGPIPITIYKPAGTGPFPVVLFIHGGGWVIADRKVYDASARALTNASGAIVVSTDYRQGPENRFPAAHDDTYAAYLWVRANAAAFGGDATKIAVAGESAGGNMAASITMRARQNGVPQPAHQLLIYPVTDAALGRSSHVANTSTAPLSTPGLAWFYEKYLSNADAANPLFSVLRGNLSGLPPATVITADIDPLRSDGAAYAQKLREAGVGVEFRNYEGVTHEFFGMGAVVDEAKQAVTQAGGRLKAAFAK